MSLNFVTQKLKTQRLEEEQERRINVSLFTKILFYFFKLTNMKIIYPQIYDNRTFEGYFS